MSEECTLICVHYFLQRLELLCVVSLNDIVAAAPDAPTHREINP